MPAKPRAKSASTNRVNSGGLAAEVAALRKELTTLKSTANPKRSGGKRRRANQRPKTVDPTTIEPIPISAQSSRSSAPVYELKHAHPAVAGISRCGASRVSEAEQKEDIFFGGALDFARIHWLTGHWQNLAEIDLQQIEGHPDRARLALFGAVGWLSKKDWARARHYVQAAVRYGCPANLISRVLLTGVHASLAASYQLSGRERMATKHRDHLQQMSPMGAPVRWSQLTPTVPENSDVRASSSDADLSPSPRIRAAASSVVSCDNPTAAVARALRSSGFTPRERFVFLREVSIQFLSAGNKMVAAGFVEEASHLLDTLPDNYRKCAIKDLLGMGLRQEAFELALRGIGTQEDFTPEEKKKLQDEREALREKILNAKGHGHEVLLAFLSAKADELRKAKEDRPPTLIEIGTTRESAADQGSTRRLMDFCRINGFHFITVDMDSANIQMAAQMFRESEVSFEAVHAKGEYFLESYEGDMDCIFLDAYDFDHGKHSELRQSRYEKFLGTRISDADCHKMHLDCAAAIVNKLQPWTIICLDDTWLEAGLWVAKGTLAIPYLLKHGLQLLDVRNRSALLGGNMWFQESTL